MRWLLAGLLFWTTAASAEPGQLARYPSLGTAAVTVSGLSAGAFFAHQMHVAYSGTVGGAGLVAGGPYGCAEPQAAPWWIGMHPYGRTVTAVSVCTRIGRDSVEAWSGWWGPLPEAPTLDQAVAVTDVARAGAMIDDPANLADDRVWVFSGARDTVVPAATVAVLADYYRRVGVTGDRLAVVDDVPAGHGFPVDEFRGDSRFRKLGCGEQAPPFIIDCDRDAAGELLRHLLPDVVTAAPAEPQRERLAGFDQRPFFDAGTPSASLADIGYVYVPIACETGAAACRLHVAFHGCSQDAGTVGDDFVWDAGYNRWAEANGIVVLYPQVRPWSAAWDPLGLAGNPAGCWDWWGYSGTSYAARSGVQMRAVRAMIAHLRAE